MEISTWTYGFRTEVCRVENGEILGYVWHESNGLYSAMENTFELLADAIEHIANILPNRVRAGALIMDSVKPGWADMIDVDKLIMYDFEQCILGQVFHVKDWDDWKDVKAELNLVGKDARDYGFDDYEGAWEVLKALWVDEINRRREPMVTEKRKS